MHVGGAFHDAVASGTASGDIFGEELCELVVAETAEFIGIGGRAKPGINAGEARNQCGRNVSADCRRI